ncbi:MAG: hypothetical protein IIA64_09210 [Planctomycetes bacterium]|nr:hypothetical protein [Planctomycetota bacterium]
MTTKTNSHTSIRILFVVGLVWVGLLGCKTEQQIADRQPDPVAMTQIGDEASLAITGGAKLWAQNCIRCHNIRNPASLSDRQWEIVLHHMRVRANLTAQEHELILEFLKAAN